MCAEGKTEIFKERVEYDDTNLSFTLHGFEGHIFKLYKVFRPSCKLIPKYQGCTTRLVIECVKLNDDIPHPDKYMEFFISLTKDIDTHASKAWRDPRVKLMHAFILTSYIYIYQGCVYGNNGQNELVVAWIRISCHLVDVRITVVCYNVIVLVSN